MANWGGDFILECSHYSTGSLADLPGLYGGGGEGQPLRPSTPGSHLHPLRRHLSPGPPASAGPPAAFQCSPGRPPPQRPQLWQLCGKRSGSGNRSHRLELRPKRWAHQQPRWSQHRSPQRGAIPEWSSECVWKWRCNFPKGRWIPERWKKSGWRSPWVRYYAVTEHKQPTST